jgi:lipopolysaccharide export system permease protein
MSVIARVDRFLLKELWNSSLVGSLLALVVLLGLQVLRLSDMIVRYDLGMSDVAQMLWGLSLSFLPLVLPITFLFSLLFVFGRMSTDKEWVAASAMGYSPWRLLRSPLLMGLALSVATALSSFFVGPYGNGLFEASVDAAIRKKVTRALKAGAFSEGFLGLVVFVDRINPVNQDLERVFVYDESNYSEEVSISAKVGKFVQNKSTGVASLKLKQGTLVSVNPATQKIKRVEFDEYSVHADYSNVVGRAKNSPPSLSYGELTERRAEIKKNGGGGARPIWVEWAKRWAMSFLCLLFVPLSMGLSVDNSRTAKSRSIFYGLSVLLTYWTVYFSVVTWVLKSPLEFLSTSEPMVWLFVWIPNFLVLGVGWYYFRAQVGFKKT